MDMLEGKSTFNRHDLDEFTATILSEMEQEYSIHKAKQDARDRDSDGEGEDD